MTNSPTVTTTNSPTGYETYNGPLVTFSGYGPYGPSFCSQEDVDFWNIQRKHDTFLGYLFAIGSILGRPPEFCDAHLDQPFKGPSINSLKAGDAYRANLQYYTMIHGHLQEYTHVSIGGSYKKVEDDDTP